MKVVVAVDHAVADEIEAVAKRFVLIFCPRVLFIQSESHWSAIGAIPLLLFRVQFGQSKTPA